MKKIIVSIAVGMIAGCVSADQEGISLTTAAPTEKTTVVMNEQAQQEAVPINLQFAENAQFSSFTSVTYEDTPQQNPDTGGAVGTTQFITAVKGRVRSHLKDGTLDEALNTTLDHFFDAQSDGNFLTDPHIRFDTFSSRWYIIAITANFQEESKLILAVSDSDIITPQTVWSYFTVSSKDMGFDSETRFFDFPTLAVDQQAVYVGMVVFDQVNRNFITSAAIIFQKQSLFQGVGAQVTIFPDLFDQATGEGAQVIHPADNFDEVPADGSGFFIGNNVLLETSEQLVFYRVDNPGTLEPTISGPMTLGVPPFSQPINIPALGSTKRLNVVDNRFGSNAFIRNGRLWSAHHIGVDNTGDSSEPSCVTRNAARAYEVDISGDEISLEQTFTLFAESGENDDKQKSYVFPAVMLNENDDLIIAASTAGVNQFLDGIFALGKGSDLAGTIQECNYTNSEFTFNPSQDSNRDFTLYRIGDFSGANIDPVNPSNFFIVTEFAAAQDTWGTEVANVIPTV